MTSEPTVFIVDDDDAVRRFLTGLIRSIDLRVEAFASATDFLDAYRPGRPGCLLLDVRMPGMSGLELQ
ncbi:MAG: response regulator transcription factor, partial [Alphaproteobacteria bacterium]